MLLGCLEDSVEQTEMFGQELQAFPFENAVKIVLLPSSNTKHGKTSIPLLVSI